MRSVYASITLLNGDDLMLAKKHIIPLQEIKQLKINIGVHKGPHDLCINEEIQQQLQLPIIDKRKVKTADGSIVECDIAGNVTFRFNDRTTTCSAMVLPGNATPLVSAILLENKLLRL